MASYISADGTVGGEKTLWRSITNFFGGIYSLLGLFFSTITNPKAVENNRSSSTTRTFAQRNQGRSYRGAGTGNTLGGAKGNGPKKGSNIRGMGSIQGDANVAVGGG
mmetsp:Transcript_1628/g.2330  ORF Transcript_1628/g.2330 Transcript_1628/m.2330 type:complete len:107 (-) Transcript_1628:545-865(-)|eukprot:CAMPEP_0198142884 /NCGR_PEP_ID=MMETSP1443-20131203/5559_1 /TAXON_ID=186043 /ORGANISM="Entomoneis sp., Strain CCMP2396" /LENGTH=106 /DNA_ID=CAMNT_0043806003 /DNA_START=63 /DNA_END=383 /DNA_ORIENTATION=-